MNYFPQLSKTVKANQKTLIRLISRISKGKELRERCALAHQAAVFATGHNTDVFASSEIEQPFLELAELLPAAKNTAWEKDSVLHIATEVYNSGGHSRCIERWIQLMEHQKHSCYLIHQKAGIPELLTTLTLKSGGEVRCANPAASMVTKAAELREYASRFQYIVLHIHMDDPVALIAFGSEKFTRPIIFFNHADHIFWLGAGIADYVADITGSRHKITITSRTIQNASVLSIPVETDTAFAETSQAEARKTLGIAPEEKIIFASGHPRKFDPVGTPDFADVINAILQKEPQARFFIAGASPKQVLWKKLTLDTRSRVTFTGRLDYKTEYPLYLAAADMVLDSMPVTGGTAVIDAVKAGRAVLAIRGPFLSDFINNSAAGCADLDELVSRTCNLLHDDAFRTAVYSDIREKWEQETDKDAWKQRCLDIYNALPQQHRLHSFTTQTPPEEVSEISLLTCMWTEPGAGSARKIRRWIYSRNRTTGVKQFLGVRIQSSKVKARLYWDKEIDTM